MQQKESYFAVIVGLNEKPDEPEELVGDIKLFVGTALSITKEEVVARGFWMEVVLNLS